MPDLHAGATTAAAALPLRPGHEGEAVRDVQRRLHALGYELAGSTPSRYDEATRAAVERFQQASGLHADGVVGTQTWSSLVEAGYHLGDRFLYLRSPMLRGDDVGELQRRLGALGFDAGRVDGIFGARTSKALIDFQRNAGLTTDGICGPDALAALQRLGSRATQSTTVAKVREQEQLLDTPRSLLGRRVAVGETGGVSALADRLGHTLADDGAIVDVLHHPDGSVQAGEANEFKAEVYLGLAVLEEPACVVSYFAVEGFESVGGHRLAEVVLGELPSTVCGQGVLRGMRLPILRETRMPAVLCEIGPAAIVVERGPELVSALERAVTAWIEAPLGS